MQENSCMFFSNVWFHWCPCEQILLFSHAFGVMVEYHCPSACPQLLLYLFSKAQQALHSCWVLSVRLSTIFIMSAAVKTTCKSLVLAFVFLLCFLPAAHKSVAALFLYFAPQSCLNIANPSHKEGRSGGSNCISWGENSGLVRRDWETGAVADWFLSTHK